MKDLATEPEISIDRRRGSRFAMGLPVVVTYQSHDSELQESVQCMANSMSELGMALEGQKLPSVRSHVGITIALPGRESPLVLKGRVMWRHDSDSEAENQNEHAGILLDTSIEETQTFHRTLDSIKKMLKKDERRRRQRRSNRLSDVSRDGRAFDRRSRVKLFGRAYGWMKRLDEWRGQGTYFYLKQMDSVSAPRVVVDGREIIMLASNNYLGLANHPKIIEATIAAVRQFGTASGAARLLTGSTKLHRQLEERIAEFKGAEDAIVYSTGYLANLGVISTLVERDDILFLDEKVHASIVDGSRFTGASIRVFRHNDAKALERKLLQHRGDARKLVIVDGVYSMDGDIAALPEIIDVARKHSAMVMVDDAHATGLLGATGRGTEEHFGLTTKADITVGTFSKALASAGGFVCGSRELVSYLKHFSRAFIFNTSMPPAVCATSIAAIQVIQEEPEIIKRLWDNGQYMLEGLQSLGFDTGLSETPIIPVLIGHETKMNQIMGYLFENGVMVSPIGRPAVKRNSSRLRVNVMATHVTADLDKALDLFRDVYKKYGPFETEEKCI